MSQWYSTIFLASFAMLLLITYGFAYAIAKTAQRIPVPAHVEHDNYPARTRIISFIYPLPNGRRERASRVLPEDMKSHYPFVAGFNKGMAITVYVSPYNSRDVALDDIPAKSLGGANRVRRAHLGFLAFTVINIIAVIATK